MIGLLYGVVVVIVFCLSVNVVKCVTLGFAFNFVVGVDFDLEGGIVLGSVCDLVISLLSNLKIGIMFKL